MGITVYVAQKIGEQKEEDAGRAIGTGILFFIFLGIVMSALLVIFTSFLAALLHAPAEAYEQTCSYITVCGYGTLFICLYNLLGAIFRGIGDSKTPLITVMIACVCNIIADLLFVAGFGMGATGAALATIIAQAISVVVSLFIIRRKPLPFVFKTEFIKLQPRVLLKELKLGAPIALQDLLVGISFLVIHARGQQQNTTTINGFMVPVTVYKGDTIPSLRMPVLYVFKDFLKFKNEKERREFYKLVRNVKKTLPLAKEINGIIIETYEYLQTLPDEKSRDKHLKRVEKGLKEQYTPRLKKMTFSQGKLLIKLINRQTDSSSYELVKAFLGSFKAGFYQAFASVFGASLKKEYHPEGEDALTERVVLMVESGQI
jgi:hypothetical protein